MTASQDTVSYSYETNRDVMTIIDNKVSGSSISKYTYTYDALGRRDDRAQSGSEINTASTDDFTYNSRSEVTGSSNSVETATKWNPTYSFDKIGNRIGSVGVSPNAYTANELNQYTAIVSTNPVHDLDGNLTSDGGTWTYTWNNENRLASATDGTTTIDFTYDYQGRLVKRDDGTDVSVYVYDGWNRIFEISNPGSQIEMTSSFLWGLDLSGSMQGAGGVGGLLKEGDLYPLYDANGNIMQKLDGAGAAVMSVDYDPFGNIINGTLVGEYGFSTKPLIDGIDWYYYGFRYYDPQTGRWPSRDPIGKQGGINLYGFVGNEVTYAIDFLGLTKTCQSVSFSVSIPATKGKIRLAPPFYAKVGGSFSIAVEGEICDECCDGEMKETWEISATASGSVGITLGVGEDIDVSYGRNFSITGFAGAQASGTIGVSGGGSFGKSCDGTVTGTGSGSVSGDLGVRGGASLQATLRKGRWEWEFAKTSATISGTAGVSADYEFKCNTSGCSLEKFGDYSVNASVTAEVCALGYCISHTF
ncbi:RHS repeat-associated core domain-containing protein [Coraliomargarita sp. SDUM461003]|uniref:RHS repeat-associated core domain-containing protein n=1 Tax=Thalassobacterium maritimum TaxID=3041265 RepID=A0ABU1AZA2_9BACT|nr:RHS repeat-associated core domain-containing protein [Coraliomargarita sp. SDUM461003]MDQ8209457.1 RHS repeat-associated core domain-containing protein [Coraliomargarita sp. SDUM461003]